jgi:hypothetical protein
VNDTLRLAPWADMLLALDGNWPAHYREFSGVRLTGIEDDSLDAFYIGHRSETVQLRPGHIVSIRNSGLMALRIAAEMGAARILLAGFEPETPLHFDGSPAGPYIGLTEGLEQVTAELRRGGVMVEQVSPLVTKPRKPRR